MTCSCLLLLLLPPAPCHFSTSPISAVSAGLYLGGLLNESIDYFHLRYSHLPPNYFAAGFAVLVTLYFWRKNIIGIHESSEKALRIMQVTSVMVVKFRSGDWKTIKL